MNKIIHSEIIQDIIDKENKNDYVWHGNTICYGKKYWTAKRFNNCDYKARPLLSKKIISTKLSYNDYTCILGELAKI